MAFKIGDRVKHVKACNGGTPVMHDEGSVIGVVSKRSYDDGLTITVGTQWVCDHLDTWELVSDAEQKMVDIKTLTKAQKEAWSKDQQALYRVGLTDANGEFIGSDVVTKATARVNKTALVAQAEADIKEAEEEAKKAEKVK